MSANADETRRVLELWALNRSVSVIARETDLTEYEVVSAIRENLAVRIRAVQPPEQRGTRT